MSLMRHRAEAAFIDVDRNNEIGLAKHTHTHSILNIIQYSRFWQCRLSAQLWFFIVIGFLMEMSKLVRDLLYARFVLFFFC